MPPRKKPPPGHRVEALFELIPFLAQCLHDARSIDAEFVHNDISGS